MKIGLDLQHRDSITKSNNKQSSWIRVQNKESISTHIAFGEVFISLDITDGFIHHVPFTADDHLDNNHER